MHQPVGVPTPSPRRNRKLLAAAAMSVLALGLMPLSQPAYAAEEPAIGLETLLDRIGGRQGGNYAVVVDTSDSMERNGYYAKVRDVLPKFLASLTAEDKVCFVPFSTGARDCELVPKAEAQAQLDALPPRATGLGSNFGRAFESGLDGLRRSEADASGVLLLSDAKLNAPDDPRFETFKSPGWAELRSKAATLPGSEGLTGYGIPLGEAHELEDVLAKAFPHYKMLDASEADLSRSMAEAHDDTRIKQARQAVRAEAGKGVTVSWPEEVDEQLRTGSEIRIRLTATTEVMPVRVDALSLRGLPHGVRFSPALPKSLELEPGQTQDVVLSLTAAAEERSGLFGSTEPATWRLSVAGAVSSPLSGSIKHHLGGLTPELAEHPSGKPLSVTGSVRTSSAFGWWAGLLSVLAAGAAAALYALRRSYRSIGGTLMAEAVDRPTPLLIPLQGRRTVTADLSPLIEGSGTLWIKGLPGPRSRQPSLRLRCRIADRATREAVCAPGSSVLLSGIEFRYESGR
ncbi:vWA domain-containing protein [Streptomyces sp. NPDC051219]|uniref:vWA domain-containing protein n=1 Tax=Streptomyces sp. NPDC051219 TaxID=3155283 RepID=UPI003424E949